MRTQHKLLTVKEVVQILMDKEVVSEEIAEALLILRYWTIKTPLTEDAPTMLFKGLMKIAGYKLHYQENMETYGIEYWSTKLGN